MPNWRWPHGWSTRRRVTKVGIKSCPGLKNAELPRQALVMLVDRAAAPTPVVVLVVAPVVATMDGLVSAAQAAMFGIWLVSVKNAPVGPSKLGFGFSAANAADQ